MVRHIAAHDGIFLPVDPLGAEIGGLIEAAAARHLHLLQLVEVFQRRLRLKRQQQKGGVRRDHQIVVQPSFQAELLHAVRLILIIELRVKRIKPALGNPPGDAFSTHPLLLAIGAKAHCLLAERAVVKREKQMRHIIFKHRARPGNRARIPPFAREHPAQRPPVLFGRLAAAYGIVAHHTRFAHQKVVIGAGKFPLLSVEADVKQPAARMIERREVALLQKPAHPVCLVGKLRLLGGVFQQPLPQRGQTAKKIAAVHSGNIARLHDAQGSGIIPVVKVPVPFFQLFNAGEHPIDPLAEHGAVDKRKIPRGKRAEQSKADIRWRSAMCNPMDGRFLHIIRR